MSAAAVRLFRMLWIAMVAALGVIAVRPDVSIADNGSASADSRPARVSGEMPYRRPIGDSAVRLDGAAPFIAAAEAHFLSAGEKPNLPNTASDPSDVPQAPAASAGIASSLPRNMPHQPSPQQPSPATVPAHAALPDNPPPQDALSEPDTSLLTPETYVVTAHYLNVRAEPDKASPIRGLLARGDRVSVVGKTENGWLELENGLYIHGAYAEPDETDAVPAKNAGREVSIASASPSVRPQPAILKPAEGNDAGEPAPLSRKVKSDSGLTEADIALLLEGTALEGHGLEEAILGIEEEYGINALFTIAVMKLESGNGKSKLAREKNNLFGLNATGGSNSKAYRFETKSDSVYKFGKIIAKSYLDKGYSTIEKVGKKYCPANPEWATLVENIMKRDLRKLTGTAV